MSDLPLHSESWTQPKYSGRGMYMYGSSGFGKTELIKQYLKSQKYIYIPCLNDCCDLSVIPDDCTIDNVNAIKNAKLRGEIAATE